MITLLFSGRNDSIIKAVEKANEILQSEAFYDKIAALPQMSNTNLTSSEIAALLKASNQKITVHAYWNPFGSVVKTFNPYQFGVNTKKISCITAYAVNTLINETIHSVALMSNKLDYTSTNVDPDEELNVLPWRIGEIAEIISRKTRKFA